ncbi:SH3-domain-containing protein [Artomyces pyxidatus]|uniref:SH3-domain-containing protein n=1 Tax=Artomyces pyxidatus TaxID=48021 RepID=A0ACB8SRP1_9AGAM|nr:SH3-domain-containing protein [Artomyces pyxidatus]
MPDSAALIAHIVSQTRQNVEFLMAQNEISRDAGQGILAKLPTSSDLAIRDLSDQTRRMTMPSSGPTNDYGPPPLRRDGPPPPPRSQRAKALWSYNENSQEPNDLSFRAGDIIEIVTETNADWWTGRHNGRQGLFPSNYVEKLESNSPPPPSYPAQNEYRPSPSPYPQNEYRGAPSPYPPPQMNYGAPPPSNYQPPPPQSYNSYVGPPIQNQPPQQVVVQQDAPQQQQKPSRFGGLGTVLATSAAGGVGFGAGSAIGSDLVHAIF